MTGAARHYRGVGLAAAALALVADQASKLALLYGAGFIQKPDTVIPLLPFFNLTLVRNSGVSYGLFAGAPIWVLVGLALAAICGLLWWLWTTTSLAVALGTGLVIGGAIGNNLIDRAIYGRVTDFFHLFAFGYSWYVFNVADVAICAGAAALVYEMIMPHHPPQGGAA